MPSSLEALPPLWAGMFWRAVAGDSAKRRVLRGVSELIWPQLAVSGLLWRALHERRQSAELVAES